MRDSLRFDPEEEVTAVLSKTKAQQHRYYRGKSEQEVGQVKREEKGSESQPVMETQTVAEETMQETASGPDMVKTETTGAVGKKQKYKRILREGESRKSVKLKFEKEPGDSPAKAPLPKGKSKGKVSVDPAPAETVKTVASGKVREKVDEDSDENSAVEAANQAEETAENTAGRLTDTVKSHTVQSKGKSSEKLSMDSSDTGARTAPLRFDDEFAEEIPQSAKGYSNAQSKVQQTVRYRREYAAAKKAGESTRTAGSGVFGTGAGKTAASKGAESMTEKLKHGFADIVRRNKGWIAVLILCGMALILTIEGVGTMGSLITGGGNAVLESSYLASDDEIYEAENYYSEKEAALQRQINNIESTYPGYDEYDVQVDEISHNPYTLTSYLTVKYGNFLLDDVTGELNSLFQAQYHLSVESTTREEIETDYDPETGEETETITTIYILNVTLTNAGLETVAINRLNDQEATGWYRLLNSSYGNRDYLWDTTAYQGYTPGGMSYEIPPEALQDDQFRRMITEAERYLGYPYVWGGSSPSTSFDCSGFVSYVINHCGNGWNVGRLTAEGLRNRCTYVSPSEAKPGDLIFFQGTYDTSGASHVGIYVGNGMMIHCGNPIQYASIETNYWQQHFYCFGRIS